MRPAQPVLARAALLGALLCAPAACGAGGGDPADSGGRPAAAANLVLISLDTLRADRLTVYGYERPTSPRLAEFADTATVFTRARAASPWTLPSHASMFTGLYPHEHGARTWPLEDLERVEHLNNAARLEEDFVTVAEVLAGAGYRTVAIAANTSFLKPPYGLAQGFEHYDVAKGRVGEVNARALAWLDRRGDEPFFLFLNYMDTHRPLNDESREGFPPKPVERTPYFHVRDRILMEKSVKPQHLEALSIDYDVAVANLDQGLGALFDELRARGLFDGALIIVTSDHGEFLGEHALIEHSKDVYQEVVHVPLLIKQPGQTEPRIDREVIGHVHLPRILLEAAGLTAEAGIPAALASHWPRAFALSESYGPRLRDLDQPWGARLDRVRRSISRGPYKYIESSDGRHELYDTQDDPREQRDLIESEPELAAELARELERWTAAHDGARPPELVEPTEEHAAELRELGYLGGDHDG